jgi:hypothetical protein
MNAAVIVRKRAATQEERPLFAPQFFDALCEFASDMRLQESYIELYFTRGSSGETAFYFSNIRKLGFEQKRRIMMALLRSMDKAPYYLNFHCLRIFDGN